MLLLDLIFIKVTHMEKNALIEKIATDGILIVEQGNAADGSTVKPHPLLVVLCNHHDSLVSENQGTDALNSLQIGGCEK